MTRITPFLWYSEKAEEAAAFYASFLPNSKVNSVSSLPADSPSGPAGSVKIVDFTLCGVGFQAMTAGPMDNFNHSISLYVECDTQEEVDTYWSALIEGGEAQPCGWLKDKYGLVWQIAPRQLLEMIKSPDRAAAKRAAEAMMKVMGKIELAPIEKAFKG